MKLTDDVNTTDWIVELQYCNAFAVEVNIMELHKRLAIPKIVLVTPVACT